MADVRPPIIDWGRLLKVASIVVPIISTVLGGGYIVVGGIATVVRSVDEVHSHLTSIDSTIKQGNDEAVGRWRSLDELQKTVAKQGDQIGEAVNSSKRAEDAATSTNRQLADLMTQLLAKKRMADSFGK